MLLLCAHPLQARLPPPVSRQLQITMAPIWMGRRLAVKGQRSPTAMVNSGLIAVSGGRACDNVRCS